MPCTHTRACTRAPSCSSFSLGYLDEYFHFRSPLNKLIGDKGEEDSQFEGIAYVPENNTFLLLQEVGGAGGQKGEGGA